MFFYIYHFWGSSFIPVYFSYHWYNFLTLWRTSFNISYAGLLLSVLIFWGCFYFRFIFEVYFYWIQNFWLPISFPAHSICHSTAFWPILFLLRSQKKQLLFPCVWWVILHLWFLQFSLCLRFSTDWVSCV